MHQLGRGRYAFGQYSDDSQLARELVVSIVDRGKFDAVDYASRIAALFRENRIVGRVGGFHTPERSAHCFSNKTSRDFSDRSFVLVLPGTGRLAL